MEEAIKKRGRKKTIQEPVEVIPEQEEPIKKKRGRKKKWETTSFKNNYSTEGSEKVSFKESETIDVEKYTTNALNFGNLCIKVHDNKDTEQDASLDNYFVNKKDKETVMKNLNEAGYNSFIIGRMTENISNRSVLFDGWEL